MNFEFEITGNNIMIQTIMKEDEKYLIGKITGIGHNVPQSSKLQIGDVVLIQKDKTSLVKIDDIELYFISYYNVFCKVKKSVELPTFEGLEPDF